MGYEQVQYSIRDGISIRRIGEEIFIFDRTASLVHSFNQVGAFILGLVMDDTDMSAIIEKVCERFDVTEDVARTDVEEFISELIKKNVLCSKKGK